MKIADNATRRAPRRDCFLPHASASRAVRSVNIAHNAGLSDFALIGDMGYDDRNCWRDVERS